MEATTRAHPDHVPQTKKFVTYMLYAAGGLSVLVLALCAYSVSVYSKVLFDILTPALAFMMFTCIWTWGFLIAIIILPKHNGGALYQKWVVLGLFALTSLFWLIAFALLAARVNAMSFVNNLDTYLSSYSYDYNSYNYKRSPEPKKSSSSSSSTLGGTRSYYSKYATAWKVAAAATGIGALIWVLVTAALVFFGLACFQHQQAGASDSYEGEPKPMPPAAPGHEMNNYGGVPPNTTTPNPEQQFAHNQQYGGNQYDQSAYNQNQAYQQPPPQQQHQIPT